MDKEQRIAGLTCAGTHALLNQYADGDLSLEARRQVEDHVRACEFCTRALDAAMAAAGAPEGLERDAD